jgi:hypothetical protein
MAEHYFYGGNEARDSGLGSDDGGDDEEKAARLRAVENWVYDTGNPFESHDRVTKQPVAQVGLRIHLRFLDTGERLAGEHMQNAGRQVLRELYKLHTQKDPEGVSAVNMADEVLPHLLKPGKDTVELEVKVVRVDLKNPTASFTGPMSNLDKFLPDSRRRFVNDALSHLEGLDQTKKEPTQTMHLAMALANAAKAGHLDERHLARLGALSKKSDRIRRTFKVAEYTPPLNQKSQFR